MLRRRQAGRVAFLCSLIGALDPAYQRALAEAASALRHTTDQSVVSAALEAARQATEEPVEKVRDMPVHTADPGTPARAGESLRCDVAVRRFLDAAGRVTGVELSDGSVLAADLVAVTVGARPAVDWLAGSGLRVGDGVECDPWCRAAPGIYAAGDVSSWDNDLRHADAAGASAQRDRAGHGRRPQPARRRPAVRPA